MTTSPRNKRHVSGLNAESGRGGVDITAPNMQAWLVMVLHLSHKRPSGKDEKEAPRG